MLLPSPLQFLRLVFLLNGEAARAGAQGGSFFQQILQGVPLVLILTTVLTLVILTIAVRRLNSDERDTYLGSVLITAAVIPMIASAILVVVYLLVLQFNPGDDLQDRGIYSVMFSLVLALISWVILTGIYRRFTRVDTANVGSYNELVGRLDKLRVRHAACCSEPANSELDTRIVNSACQQVKTHIDYLGAVLSGNEGNQQPGNLSRTKESAL
ncbi:MAG: hypothetical protein M3328_16610 [Chloroflexota bacterium]|nr:hypothetical protein [Chloroflexota bacterium]